MEKLGKFADGKSQAGSDGQVIEMPDLDIFKLFRKYIDKIIVDQGKTIDVSRLLEL
jgi:hypothetical protein